MCNNLNFSLVVLLSLIFFYYLFTRTNSICRNNKNDNDKETFINDEIQPPELDINQEIQNQLITNVKNKVISHVNKKYDEINNTNEVSLDNVFFNEDVNIKEEDEIINFNSKTMNVQVDTICFNNKSICMPIKTLNKVVDVMYNTYDVTNLNKVKEEMSFGTKLKIFDQEMNYIFSQDDNDYVIYDNIFEPFKQKIISIKGSPTSDILTYEQKTLITKNAIKIGNNNEISGNGCIIVIPSSKFKLLWLQVPINRWTIVEAKYEDGTPIGIFGDGFSTQNIFTPNGTDTNVTNDYLWMSIPIMFPDKKVVITPKDIITTSDANPISTGVWLFGLGFSTNPWNYTYTNSRVLSSANNGGSKIGFNSNNWNGYPLGFINSGQQSTLYIPVIPSNYNKMLYVLTHNDDWNSSLHTGITVNGVQIERLFSYNNAFNRHFTNIGGNQYVKYMAAIVPKELINKTDRFLKVTFDMTKQNNNLFFRLIGTHDQITASNFIKNN